MDLHSEVALVEGLAGHRPAMAHRHVHLHPMELHQEVDHHDHRLIMEHHPDHRPIMAHRQVEEGSEVVVEVLVVVDRDHHPVMEHHSEYHHLTVHHQVEVIAEGQVVEIQDLRLVMEHLLPVDLEVDTVVGK